jgi:hypothetical protein
MAITTTRTKDEFIALCDNALETAINTCMNTTLVPASGVTAVRKVTRAQVCKTLAQRAMRKSTQGAMRREVLTSPAVTPGA